MVFLSAPSQVGSEAKAGEAFGATEGTGFPDTGCGVLAAGAYNRS